jgi:ribosomal protein L44E
MSHLRLSPHYGSLCKWYLLKKKNKNKKKTTSFLKCEKCMNLRVESEAFKDSTYYHVPLAE